MQHCPDVPDIWLVLIGTNLTRQEVLAFEEKGFQLQQRQDVSPIRLFGDSSIVASSMAELPTPAQADQYPTLRFGKKIQRSNKGPSRRAHDRISWRCQQEQLGSAALG